jgi:hypothetical protein
MKTLVRTATVRGGHCSFGKVWSAHLEGRKFSSIDFIWGTERGDIYTDPTPAKTGDTIRVTIGPAGDNVDLKGGWFAARAIKRIASYEATVIGGWPTTFPRGYGTPNYWYVTFAPDLAFNCERKIPFSIQLGTLTMPFCIGDRVKVTVDLMNENLPAYREASFENYTYSA